MPERDDYPFREEALARQGTIVKGRRGEYFIEGDHKAVKYQEGAEGLVHWAVEQRTGARYRIKVFWEPDDNRLARSRHLVTQRLANQTKSIDVLAGAPFALLDSMGGVSRFALVMKNVNGESWYDIRENAKNEAIYPPPDWPSFKIRLLWAYGLACAVEAMEARNFVHADISEGNVVVIPSSDRAGELALVDFDAYFNKEYRSNYLGTPGFVAPEIFNRGPIGVGSDRVAMAVLIQDFLIVGDPELSANDAFEARYTQDQICAFQSTAHPLLKQKYRAVADLVDRTLGAEKREDRPAPIVWREILRPLYDAAPAKIVRITASTGDTDVLVALNPGEERDLVQTPFGIRADIVRQPDGSLHVRPHTGASVRFQPSDESWREIGEGEKDVLLTGGARLYDREGNMQAELTLQGREGPDPAVPVTPEDFHPVKPIEWLWLTWVKRATSEINWTKVGYGLLFIVAIILLLWIARELVRIGTKPPPVTNVRQELIVRLQGKDWSRTQYDDPDFSNCWGVAGCSSRAAQAQHLRAMQPQDWSRLLFDDPRLRDCMGYKPCDDRETHSKQLQAIADWRHAGTYLLADCMGFKPCEQAKSFHNGSNKPREDEDTLPACCKGNAACLAEKKKENIPDCASPMRDTNQ